MLRWSSGGPSPTDGQRILLTPEVAIYWRSGRLTVRARRWTAVGDREPPRWTFEGDDARDALIVFQVAFMRGGAAGLREALRDVFEPRGHTLDGMFQAEQRAYRRVNGMIVRDMES
jgi:hypothetical protein